jgi:hypothetical protein
MNSLSPLAAALVILSSPAWAQQGSRPANPTTSSSTPMLVTDSGQAVGRYVVAFPESGVNQAALINSGGQVVSLGIAPFEGGRGFTWLQAGNVVFTSSNCSGQAFIFPSLSLTKVAGVPGRLGSQYFGYIQSGNTQTVTYQSQLDGTGACIAATFTDSFFPATTIPLAGPPLYVQ